MQDDWPELVGRSIVGSGYLLIRLTLNRTYQRQGFSELGADPIDGVEQVGVVDLPPFIARKVVGVAEDDAGVAGAGSNMVGAIVDAGEVVVDVDWICASSVVMAMKLSEPMV